MGQFILYFKNKEDILISVFQEKMGIFVDNLKDIIERRDIASEKLCKMIENHFQVLSRRSSFSNCHPTGTKTIE